MASQNYSIVLLSFNHPDLTTKALESILKYYSEAPQNVILVHNGSRPENTLRLQERFRSVTHLVLPKNKGFSGGANAGLAKAFTQAKQVFFLTNDTEVLQLPTCFPESCDLMSPLIYKRQTTQIDSLMGVVETSQGHLKHLRTSNEISNLNSHEIIYAPGTAFGISKKCFELLNGFDESFHTYWEDVDLGVRAQKQGFRIQHSSEFQLRHKIGKTCHKDRFYTLYLYQRNRKRFMKKNSFYHFKFICLYSVDMLKLFFRILLKPQSHAPLKLWWKALYDTN
jgi:GT2 family glycosyltransferase